MQTVLSAPDVAAALTLALVGAGLVQLPTHVCKGAIEEGRLVRLLAKQEPPRVPVHVTWAEGSHPAQALVDLFASLAHRGTPR